MDLVARFVRVALHEHPAAGQVRQKVCKVSAQVREVGPQVGIKPKACLPHQAYEFPKRNRWKR